MKKLFLLLFIFLFLNVSFSKTIELKKCAKFINESNLTINFPINILAKNTTCFEIVNSSNIYFNCSNKNLLGLKFNKAFLIKNSKNITISKCILRNFQEGLILINVSNSKFIDLRFFNVIKPFYLENTKNNEFKGLYTKEQFTFKGENINSYPFFDLSSFLKQYKVSILFFIFANIALILDYLYRKKLKEFFDEDYFYGLVLSLFFAYIAAFIVENEKLKSILNFIAILSLFAPYLYEKFKEFLFIKEVEEEFQVFVMDLSQLVKSGMSLTQAIITLSKNNYGLLTPLVEKLAVRLSWGLNFKESMELFAEESRSNLIKRVIKGLIETRESGGNIINYLDSLIMNLSVLNNLKKERESIMYRKTTQFYLMYFFLILTIVGLNKFVLPFVQEATKKGIEMTAVGSFKANVVKLPKKTYNYNSIFFFLAITQSIFSGLIIGKLTSGNIKAGLKHVAILFPITYIIMKLAGF